MTWPALREAGEMVVARAGMRFTVCILSLHYSRWHNEDTQHDDDVCSPFSLMRYTANMYSNIHIPPFDDTKFMVTEPKPSSTVGPSGEGRIERRRRRRHRRSQRIRFERRDGARAFGNVRGGHGGGGRRHDRVLRLFPEERNDVDDREGYLRRRDYGGRDRDQVDWGTMAGPCPWCRFRSRSATRRRRRRRPISRPVRTDPQ